MELPPDVDYFKVDVREYEDIDNEIRVLNEKIKPIQQKIKELKAKKSSLQGNLCEFMARNKIDACNVSGLDKIPSKKITGDCVSRVPNQVSLSQLNSVPLDIPLNRPMISEISTRDIDSVSVSTAASSVRLSYSTSTRTKPATKEFIKTQCHKFFAGAWKSEDFRRLTETEKGKFLFDYLYNPDDREVIEKPLLKKTIIN